MIRIRDLVWEGRWDPVWSHRARVGEHNITILRNRAGDGFAVIDYRSSRVSSHGYDQAPLSPLELRALLAKLLPEDNTTSSVAKPPPPAY